MAEVTEKKVNVYIPKDAVGSNEKSKKIIINDVMYSVPVGKNVEVPENVAKVIVEWLENLSSVENEREERMAQLEN